MYATLTYFSARCIRYDEGAFYVLSVVDQVGPKIVLRDYLELETEMHFFERFDIQSDCLEIKNGVIGVNRFAYDDMVSDADMYRVAVLEISYRNDNSDVSRIAYLANETSELLRWTTIGGYLLSPGQTDERDFSVPFEDMYIEVKTFDRDYKIATFARGLSFQSSEVN
jgi:hypothetical protein|tara:strand:- start:1338 stop:1841 length:504 start_codon:yes stop_codon:yes gene_type:complete